MIHTHISGKEWPSPVAFCPNNMRLHGLEPRNDLISEEYSSGRNPDMNIYIYIWPYMADEKKYIYIFICIRRNWVRSHFLHYPEEKKRSTVCFSLLVPPVSASTVGSPYLTLICFFGHDGWIHIPLIDGDFLMVMFIPCRLKIINRLFSRVCFYFHLCPVITVESHSGRPSPKKRKAT